MNTQQQSVYFNENIRLQMEIKALLEENQRLKNEIQQLRNQQPLNSTSSGWLWGKKISPSSTLYDISSQTMSYNDV
jgi:hypothetical protein